MINKIKEKIKSADKGLVIRTATLILTAINEIIAIVGFTTFANATWYQILSLAALLIAAFINWWENNDVTAFAKLATAVLNALKDGKITAEEIKEILKSVSSDKTDKIE